MKTFILVCGYGGLGKAIVQNLVTQGKKNIIIISQSVYSNEDDEYFKQNSIRAFQVDFTKKEQVVAFFKTLEQGEQCEALVYAAVSPLHRKKITQISEAEFRQDYEVTVFGMLNVVWTAYPHLVKNNFASIVAITTAMLENNTFTGSMGGYLSAKAAQKMILRQLALELAADKIRVNAAAPSFVRTGLHADLPERADGFIKEKNIMKEIVSPEDVAKVVSWLMSSDSKSITGVSIPVSYGEVMTL